ncbi:MAG: hypothetical protein KA035_02630 [Candidatus Levybacteria bacterium]|nr:hypothetical protein [Candidatus Levybacteria bacterium]
MAKESLHAQLDQISNSQRTQEIKVLDLRFSPNSHVAKIRGEFKKALNQIPIK